MVFSTNQVRQLYVVDTVGTVTSASAPKTIECVTNAAGDTYFKYMGAGGMTRSDIIPAGNLISAKATSATHPSQEYHLKEYTVALKEDPIVGEDYVLRLVFNNFVGMSDEDVYIKYGAVHVTSETAAKDKFYKKLAISLYKNFSRELAKLVEIKIADKIVAGVKTENGEEVPVEADGTTIDCSGAENVVIVEALQEWTRGIKAYTNVNLAIYFTPITSEGEDVIWGTVTVDKTNGTKLTNGRAIADLEYFCMGERGDQYRNIGWPNVVPTTYLVANPETDKFYILDLHYAYVGDGENPQKSEKDITIVSTSMDQMNTLLEKFKDMGLVVLDGGDKGISSTKKFTA